MTNSNFNTPASQGSFDETITRTAGSHPVGVGLGAVGIGAAAGAAGGALGGPVGAVAGAAVGAVVGGLAGRAVAEEINPVVETTFWRETHSTMPYSNNAFSYEEYAPAYRYGWESCGRSGGEGQTFDSVEGDLHRGWDKAKGSSKLGWEHAKEATRNAWNRVQHAVHGRA